MLAVFRNGGDIHSETAGMVLCRCASGGEGNQLWDDLWRRPRRLHITAKRSSAWFYPGRQSGIAKRFPAYSVLRKARGG
jgi:hypothetical protein